MFKLRNHVPYADKLQDNFLAMPAEMLPSDEFKIKFFLKIYEHKNIYCRYRYWYRQTYISYHLLNAYQLTYHPMKMQKFLPLAI